MAESIRGINVVIGADTTGLSKALSDVNKKSRDIQSELKQVERLLKFDPSNTELLAQKQQLLSQAIENARAKLDQLKSVQEQVNEQFQRGEISEGQYRAFQREVAKTEQELKKLETQLKGMEPAVKSLGERMQEAGKKMKKAGEDMTDAGKKLSVGVTAPLVGIGTLATKSAVDFESAFAGVRKTVDATEEEFAQLEQGIREMSKRMPAAATDIAAVAEAAGQLGIETPNILKFTETMIGLGEATNLTAEEGATQFARFANIVGMSQQDFDRLGSAVVALGNNFATTEAEIVNMGMRLAGQGAQIGMTEAQIMALAAAMSSVGIEAEAGGTAMSTVLKRMQTSVSLAGEDLEKFAAVARMSADEFAAAFSADPATALQAFVDGLAESSAAGENLTLILNDLGITGIRESDTLLRLAGANDVLRGAVETATDAWAENSALQNEVAQRYATTESQMGMFRNQLQDAAITLGQALIPALMDMLDVAQPLIDMIADWARWFANLDEGTQKVILGVVGFAAALGPLLVMLGSIVSGVGSLISGIGALIPAVGGAAGAAGGLGGALAALTGPVGLTIAAIAGLVAALTILYNNNETVREAINRAWEMLKQAAETIFGSIREFWSEWGDEIIGIFKGLWEIVETIWDLAFKIISKYAKEVFNDLRDFWDRWGNTIQTLFEGAWNNIKIVVETVLGVIKGIIDAWIAIFKGDWEGAWNSVKDIVSTIWDGIKRIFSNSFQTMTQIGKDIMQGLIDGIGSMAQAVWDKARSIASGIASAIKGFFGIQSPSRLMINYGEYIGEGLALGIQHSVSDVKRQAAALAEAANISAKGSFGGRGEVGGIVVNVTGNYIQNPADEDRLADKISQKIAGVYGLSSGGAW